MVTLHNIQPLGMGRGAGSVRDTLSPTIFASSHKLWIATALGVAGGLAASLIGGNQAARAARAAERRQREMEAKEDAWYNRRYNEDYIDTAAGQNLVRRAKDFATSQYKRAAGAQAVAGGTEAATAMAKEAANKMMGDTIANIAATDSQRKAQVDAQHHQAEGQFAQMDMQREMQRAQDISDATASASNAIMSVGSAIDQAAIKKTPDLTGGDNKGKVQVASGVLDGSIGRQMRADILPV